MAKKSDKLTRHTQRKAVAKLIQLAGTADPAERRRMAEQLFDDLGITPDNREYGADIERTRPGRKSGKIVLSDDDQARVMAALLAAHESNVERDHEAVRQALRDLLKMFDIGDEAQKEARQQHNERCKNGDFDLLENTIKRVFARTDAQPTAPEPQAQVEPAATYDLPTAQMRQALARFDDLADEQQVDFLSTLWGGE